MEVQRKKRDLPIPPIKNSVHVDRNISSRNVLYPSNSSSESSPRETLGAEEKIDTPKTSSEDQVKLVITPDIKKRSFFKDLIKQEPSSHLAPIVSSSKKINYVVISNEYEDAKKFANAIQGEYHMHVKTNHFISVIDPDDMVIVVCTPKTIFDHCRIMGSLIRSQKGKAVCVCILPELNRKDIVDQKLKMMSMMNEDHILFASYDKKQFGEITLLEKFWKEVDSFLFSK